MQFAAFFSDFKENSQSINKFKREFDQMHNIDEHKELARRLKENFMLAAKDEIIAYAFADKTLSTYLSQIGGEIWVDYMDFVTNSIRSMNDYDENQKDALREVYLNQYKGYFEMLYEYKDIVAKMLEESARFGSILSEEKALALLQITPLNKYKRLNRYFDASKENVQ